MQKLLSFPWLFKGHPFYSTGLGSCYSIRRWVVVQVETLHATSLPSKIKCGSVITIHSIQREGLTQFGDLRRMIILCSEDVMTRNRLSTYSIFDLYKIADNEGIKYDYSDGNREELIEKILDALEESEKEKAVSNNDAMRLKGKKYDILQDDELEAQEKQVYPIPLRYNDTRIVLLLRDPLWAYTYWDINESKVLELKNEIFFEGFFIRVFELGIKKDSKEESYYKENILDYYDIPVDENDDSWYINLGKTGRHFGIQLCALVHGKDIVLSSSNVIKSPRGFVAENIDDLANDSGTMTMLLSGLWDYNDSGENVLPQRIISILENQDLSF